MCMEKIPLISDSYPRQNLSKPNWENVKPKRGSECTKEATRQSDMPAGSGGLWE